MYVSVSVKVVGVCMFVMHVFVRINNLVLDPVNTFKQLLSNKNPLIFTRLFTSQIVCSHILTLSFTRRRWFREELSLDILFQARNRRIGLAGILKPILSHGKKLVACTGTLHLDDPCWIQLAKDNQIFRKIYDSS